MERKLCKWRWKPENLGETHSTGDESFPFISDECVLYLC
jgi:hypothetical protein